MKITANRLSAELNNILRDFGNEVDELVAEAVKETAEETVELLKTIGDYGGTEYRNSFAVQEGDAHTRGKPQYVVFSKKLHWLTHLLEHGHAKRGGKGRTRAFPHWKPAEDAAKQTVEKKIREKIEGVKS